MKRAKCLLSCLFLTCLLLSACSGGGDTADIFDAAAPIIENTIIEEPDSPPSSSAAESDSPNANEAPQPSAPQETETPPETESSQEADAPQQAQAAPHQHEFLAASCESPKICSACGETEGSAIDHDYENGKCSSCGRKDPTYVSESMVWIPTNGGTKFHSKSSCSKMIDPEQVTKSEAIRRGFDACKKCH